MSLARTGGSGVTTGAAAVTILKQIIFSYERSTGNGDASRNWIMKMAVPKKMQWEEVEVGAPGPGQVRCATPRSVLTLSTPIIAAALPDTVAATYARHGRRRCSRGGRTQSQRVQGRRPLACYAPCGRVCRRAAASGGATGEFPPASTTRSPPRSCSRA